MLVPFFFKVKSILSNNLINVVVKTRNLFLALALEQITSEIFSTQTKCNPSLLIIDTTSTLDTSKFNDLYICRAIVFIEDESHKNIFTQELANFPTIFLNLDSDFNFIKKIIIKVLFEMSIATGCFSVCSLIPDNILTRREIKVLLMHGEGLSISEIASSMFLEKKTILNYKKNAFNKLGVPESVGAFNLLKCFSYIKYVNQKNADFVIDENIKCPFKRFLHC